MIVNKFTEDEYNKIISRVYNCKADKLTVEMLSAAVIHLDGIAKRQRTKRLAVEMGMEQMIKEYLFYQNKVTFRNYQLKQLRKIVSKIIEKSFKFAKLIPHDKKCSRASALRYFKKMLNYMHLLTDYDPGVDKSGK